MGDRNALDVMMKVIPHTFSALQPLVMSMDAVARNVGKKTWFGRDRGEAAYAKFNKCLARTYRSLVLDGRVQESDPPDRLLDQLMVQMALFSAAFPNWHSAYSFFKWYVGDDNRANALAMADRLRNAA